MSCGFPSGQFAQSEAQQRVLQIALALNATMFIVGVVAGLVGQSSSLIADALDMLADASAYAIALGAIGRSARLSKPDSNLYGAFPVKWLFWVLLRVLCSERESRSSSRRLRSGSRSARKGSRDRNASIAWRLAA